MRTAVTIFLLANLFFASTLQKIDSHSFSKIPFLITHSWHHLHEDGFSIWQLINHYIDEWDAESHKPLEENPDTPYRSLAGYDFTATGTTFEYAVHLDFLDTTDLKFAFYQLLMPSGYSGSIFHPPQFS